MADHFGFCEKVDRRIFVACDDVEEFEEIAALYKADSSKVMIVDLQDINCKFLGIPKRVHKRRIRELGAEEHMHSLVDKIVDTLAPAFPVDRLRKCDGGGNENGKQKRDDDRRSVARTPEC